MIMYATPITVVVLCLSMLSPALVAAAGTDDPLLHKLAVDELELVGDSAELAWDIEYSAGYDLC